MSSLTQMSCVSRNQDRLNGLQIEPNRICLRHYLVHIQILHWVIDIQPRSHTPGQAEHLLTTTSRYSGFIRDGSMRPLKVYVRLSFLHLSLRTILPFTTVRVPNGRSKRRDDSGRYVLMSLRGKSHYHTLPYHPPFHFYVTSMRAPHLLCVSIDCKIACGVTAYYNMAL